MKTLYSLLAIWMMAVGLLADDAHQWIDRINEKYGQAETFSADFTQKNTWSELDVVKVSRGTMYFAKHKFCMRYSSPDGQYLLVDADSMLVYDSASNQTIITFPDTGEAGLRPDRILSYYAGDDAKIAVVERSESLLYIRIEPREVRDIKRIEATIDTGNSTIESVGYTDVENNTVKYQFDNIEINKKIEPGVFHFEIPFGATLIDQRL